jgi:acyl-CoA reductase-like NAD-dependent aldehyde dehydrogenase
MSAVEQFQRLSRRHRIGGELRRAKHEHGIPIVDPATEQTVGEISAASATEIREAIEIATRSQKLWATVYHRRAELLHEAARRMIGSRALVAEMGGVEAGRSVAQTCGKLYKRARIETSGNDPFIVMPSAPIEIAARAAAVGAFPYHDAEAFGTHAR